MKKKIVKRILLFVVAVPLLVVLILVLDYFHHLILNIIVVIVSILASSEMGDLLEKKGNPVKKFFPPLIGGILPTVAFLENIQFFSQGSLEIVLIVLAMVIFGSRIFVQGKEEFTDILPGITAYITVLLYPGLFMSYLVKITSLPHPSFVILMFLTMTFGNDTAAYIFGMLFGKTSRNVVLVSPNKSITGFFAGFITSIGIGLAWWFAMPELFGESLLYCLILGVVTGLSTIAGDLVESAMKRSASTKDSGFLIPGRGGILDSIDSVLFTAPAFYFILVAAT
jgi:phosphatidate cytidylyltransferase